MLKPVPRWISLCKLVIFVFCLFVLSSSFLITSNVHAATPIGSPGDPNIKFVGRWDLTNSSTVYTSYWSGAYLKTDFTGRTAKIKLASSVNIYVSIDNGNDILYVGAKGTFNLTPTVLATGTHTLRVAVRSGNIGFQGLVLDAGAKTVAPAFSSKLIEFVGDSITAGYTDSKVILSAAGWLVGEQLHVEHVHIAQSGICLVAQSGCYAMSSQYFKMGTIHDLNSPNWNFSQYQASAVVINLGTNDNGHGVPKATFQTAYTTFMRNIRAKYPRAVIFALRTLRNVYVPETQNAVKALNNTGDTRIHFVDTTGWLTAGDYSADGGHPNDQGQMKLAKHLAPIIGAAIGA